MPASRHHLHGVRVRSEEGRRLAKIAQTISAEGPITIDLRQLQRRLHQLRKRPVLHGLQQAEAERFEPGVAEEAGGATDLRRVPLHPV